MVQNLRHLYQTVTLSGSCDFTHKIVAISSPKGVCYSITDGAAGKWKVCKYAQQIDFFTELFLTKLTSLRVTQPNFSYAGEP